jgi:hypothetical protein
MIIVTAEIRNVSCSGPISALRIGRKAKRGERIRRPLSITARGPAEIAGSARTSPVPPPPSA